MRNSKVKTQRRLLKRFSAFALVLITVLGLTSCGEEKTAKYKVPQISYIESTVAAENDNFVLRWDDAAKCVLLENKATGYIWSTVPYEYYKQGKTNVNLNSPLFIEYYSPEDGSLQTLKAQPDCMSEGNVSVALVKNGIRLEFHFVDAEASVPLYLLLEDDCLKATVPLREIKESGRTQIVSISVLPYFCGIQNSDSKTSYLFVPSGSGALMYTDGEKQTVSRSFSGKVYGDDLAAVRLDKPYKEQTVKMPVFGSTDKDNSLMAVIESHEEAAVIKAEAGNMRNGYSTVYSTLELRGGDQTEAQRNDYNDEVIYADGFNKKAVYTVAYYPLTGEKSGYNGMAAKYRELLKNSGSLSSEKAEQKSYHVKLLGGSVIKKFFMGYPYNTLVATTTLKDASDIINDISSSTGNSPALTLYGYGKSGVDTGKVGGGFGVAGKLGSKKELEALNKLCRDNKIPIYADFDIVSFSSTGKGYSKLFDSAKTAEKQAAQIYPLNLGLRTEDKDGKQVRLLSRAELPSAADKAAEYAADNGLGLSLSSLSNTAYSDYSDIQYYIKGDLRSQIGKILKSVKKQKVSFAGSNANGYAAEYADMITDTPLDNGGYLGLDASIPFYAMVYGGSAALYSAPINLSDAPEQLMLNAVEAGVAPSYTLISKYNKKLTGSDFTAFYGTVYKNQKDNIEKTVGETSEYFSKIADGYIVGHEISESGITKTVFSSGVTVYVNRSDKQLSAYGKTLEANSFKYEG